MAAARRSMLYGKNSEMKMQICHVLIGQVERADPRPGLINFDE